MAKGLEEEIAGLINDSGLIPDVEPKPLQEEIRYYKSHLSEWKEEEGRYILVFGSRHYGFFDTRDDGLREGFRQFGRVPFLVKQLIQDEKPRPLGLTIY